ISPALVFHWTLRPQQAVVIYARGEDDGTDKKELMPPEEIGEQGGVVDSTHQ
ncbi:hypothetical protein MKW94_007590, partial [Papaver nudicaule]|nr:hypothetical protein [Papaver nudicaule]